MTNMSYPWGLTFKFFLQSIKARVFIGLKLLFSQQVTVFSTDETDTVHPWRISIKYPITFLFLGMSQLHSIRHW